MHWKKRATSEIERNTTPAMCAPATTLLLLVITLQPGLVVITTVMMMMTVVVLIWRGWRCSSKTKWSVMLLLKCCLFGFFFFFKQRSMTKRENTSQTLTLSSWHQKFLRISNVPVFIYQIIVIIWKNQKCNIFFCGKILHVHAIQVHR